MHIAMENGPFLDDLPIENGDSIAMLVYRTVLIYQEDIFFQPGNSLLNFSQLNQDYTRIDDNLFHISCELTIGSLDLTNDSDGWTYKHQ